MAEFDYNKDGKKDATDDAQAKLDYNKDGVVNSSDLNFISEDATKTNNGLGEWVSNIWNLGTSAIQMFSPNTWGTVATSTSDILSGTNSKKVTETRQKMTDFLKAQYNYTDDEVAKYIAAVDVMKSINDSQDGVVSKINEKTSELIKSAQHITAMKTGIANAVSPEQGAGLLGSGTISSAVMSNLNLTPSQADANINAIAAEEANVKAIASELGIDISKIPVDENISTALTLELEKYKTNLGLYSFPNKKYTLDSTNLTEEQKNTLSISNTILQTKVLNNPNQANVTNTVNPTNASGSDLTGTTSTSAMPATGAYSQYTQDNPYIVPSGIDDTTKEIYSNGDGTFTETTKNADGTVLSTNSSLGADAIQNYNMPVNVGGSTSSIVPSIPQTIFDANGNPIQVQALYNDNQAATFWTVDPDTDEPRTQEEILALKKKIYGSGFYSSTGVVSVYSTNITEDDINASNNMLRNANVNGLKYNDFMNPRYETYLMTGRPPGDKPVDLNGDGTADESVTSALQAFFKRNGVTVTDNYIKSYEDAIKNGATTLDGAMADIRKKFISSAYPAWADDINAGRDIADIASPYLQTMASTLGIPAESINMNDPLIKQALSTASSDGKPVYKSLFDFERDLRRDPRWQNTDQAQKEYADTALDVLKTFGFIG